MKIQFDEIFLADLTDDLDQLFIDKGQNFDYWDLVNSDVSRAFATGYLLDHWNKTGRKLPPKFRKRLRHLPKLVENAQPMLEYLNSTYKDDGNDPIHERIRKYIQHIADGNMIDNLTATCYMFTIMGRKMAEKNLVENTIDPDIYDAILDQYDKIGQEPFDIHTYEIEDENYIVLNCKSMVMITSPDRNVIFFPQSEDGKITKTPNAKIRRNEIIDAMHALTAVLEIEHKMVNKIQSGEYELTTKEEKVGKSEDSECSGEVSAV